MHWLQGRLLFLSLSRCRRKKPKKKPLTPMQTTPRTRAILRFPPMCRTRTNPGRAGHRTHLILRRRFAAVHIQMKQIGGNAYFNSSCSRKALGCHVLRQSPRCHQPQDGYLEGNGYLVSWCVGHLVELAPPNIYDAKYVKWSIADCPSCRKVAVSGVCQHQKAVWHPAKADAPPRCG